ncbi:hypothetical protein ABPG77_008074 [Micractinium sp. CCAP 211/92]
MQAAATAPSSLTLDVGLGLLSAEALALALLPLLLPLPLGHHIWTQLLALRSALARTWRLAALHAALEEGGGECARFVGWARLATEAVAPGGPAQLPSPPAKDSCWLAHTWMVAMVGFALPVAVQAALVAHRQGHQHMQHKQQPRQWSTGSSEDRQHREVPCQPGQRPGQQQQPRQRRQRRQRPQRQGVGMAGQRIWPPLLCCLLLVPAGVALWAALEVAAALGVAG